MRAREPLGPAEGPAPPSRRAPLYGAIVGAILASVTAAGIGASLDMPRTLMTRHDYDDARQSLEVKLRAELGACRILDGGARTLCRATARADDRVHRADLEARYRGTASAFSDARAAKVRAAFDIARARCAMRDLDERAGCMGEARSEQARALASVQASAI